MKDDREQEIELSQWLTELGVSWEGELTDLQSLNLSGKKLTSLPESIGQLTNLKELYLVSNKLTILPEWLSQLINLQTLNLSNNQITTLPESIGQLANLRVSGFGDNQLADLPKSIDRLSNLHTIDLRNNPLTDLSLLASLKQRDLQVSFLDSYLPRRYWKKISDWQPEWLLDERNGEIDRERAAWIVEKVEEKK